MDSCQNWGQMCKAWGAVTASWCTKAELQSGFAVSRKVPAGTWPGREAAPAASFGKAAAFCPKAAQQGQQEPGTCISCCSPGRGASYPSQANIWVALFTNTTTTKKPLLTSLTFYTLIFPAILTQKSSVVSSFLGKNVIYACSSPVQINMPCDYFFSV